MKETRKEENMGTYVYNSRDGQTVVKATFNVAKSSAQENE